MKKRKKSHRKTTSKRMTKHRLIHLDRKQLITGFEGNFVSGINFLFTYKN